MDPKIEWTLPISPMKASMEYLMASMQNPLQPTSCGGALVFCLIHFLDVDKTSDEECYGYRDLWTSLYRFFITERTEEHFGALLERLATCSCEEKDDMHGLHRVFKLQADRLPEKSKSNSDPTREFVAASLRLICTGIRDASIVNVAKGVSKRWPPSLSDLVPFGYDTLVRSLIQWNTYLEDETILVLMTTLIEKCGNLIHSSIIKFDTTNVLLLEPTRKRLLHVTQLLEAGFSMSSAKCSEFHTHADYFFDYIAKICTQATKAIALMNGGETKAVELCSIMCYILPHLRARSDRKTYDRIEEFISGIGRLLFATFHMHLPGRPDIPLHPLIVEKGPDAITDVGGPEQRIASAMMAGRSIYPCSSFYCDLYFSNVGNDYKKCNRCLTVGYCGRECQVRDWKDKPHSHKRICPILCKIMDKRGGWKAPVARHQDDGPIVTEAMSMACELADLILDMLYDETLSEDEFDYLLGWSDRMNEVKTSPVGKNEADLVWNAGYDDYEQILSRFTKSRRLKGLSPKPEYINRDVDEE